MKDKLVDLLDEMGIKWQYATIGDTEIVDTIEPIVCILSHLNPKFNVRIMGENTNKDSCVAFHFNKDGSLLCIDTTDYDKDKSN